MIVEEEYEEKLAAMEKRHKQELVDLKEEILSELYAPDGVGFSKAKENFDSLASGKN